MVQFAKAMGLDHKVQRALEGMYEQLVRCFEIHGAVGSFLYATSGVLQGCALNVLMINILTTIWMKAPDDLEGALHITVK